jgi:hypothetical protein
MEAGITSIESNPHKTTGSISHEIAHTMCQMAFTKSKPGQFGSIDLRWLTEALANYFSTWERITNTGSDFGYETIAEWETSLAYNGSSKYCGFSLALLERSDSDKIYQDQYYSAGHTATVFLTKTTPGGITALLNYYKFLNKDSASKAFQEAFGRTKEEFYKQYRDECINGFPTILSSGNPSTPIGQGCVSESSKDDKLTIHCLGRMAKDSLPTELQDREIIYGFEVTGIDPTTLVSDLKNIVSVPKNFLLAVDGNKLYVIIPQLAKSNDYYVNIALKDGSFASAIYHWEK